MATTTFHEYTGDGSDKTFDYSFPTYFVTEVKVQVDGVNVDNYTVPSYATSGTKTVTFDNSTGTVNTTVCESSGAPKTGLIVRVYRDTTIDAAKHTFQAGASVKAGDLNTNQEQVLRALQEEQFNTKATPDYRDNSITAAKIKNDAITQAKIADNAVGEDQIANNAVTGLKIAADQIGEQHIANDQINSEHYVDGSIDTAHIADGQINTAKLDDDAVTAAKIVDGTITTAKLANESITSAKIANATIQTADIANDAISSALIGSNAVTTAKLGNDAVTSAKIADNAIDSEHYVDGSIDSDHLSSNAVTGDKIVDGSIGTIELADNAITNAKMADDAINSAEIVDGAIDLVHMSANSVDSDQYVDGSIDAIHLASNAVETAKIANDAVTSDKIADNQIDSEHYAADSIDTEHYAPASVDATALASNAVTQAKIAADAVTGSHIGDDQINSEHYAADSIDTEHYAPNSVDNAALGADCVSGGNIADDAIDSEHYTNASIDADHLATDSVTTAKIESARLTTLADMQSATASILASNTDLTSTLAELNLLDGKSIVTTIATNATDSQLPSAQAVNERIVNVMQDSGGFVPIANKDSFPETNPDPNDDAGTIISIADAGGLVVNGSGVSTTGDTITTDATVTINGIDSSLHSSTIAAGKGMLVETTSTLNTYTYHRLVVDEAGVANAQTLVNDFNQRYRVGSSNPTSSLDDGDLFFNTSTDKMLVYNATDSSWDEVQSVGNFFINTLSSSSGSPGTGGSATFNNSANRFTLSNAGTNAQQHIVSINGVIQKPNSGTSVPSEGFAIDGSDILLSAAPATGSDYFIVTLGASVNIGTPSDNTVDADIIQSGAVTTVKLAADAVDGSKLADNACDSEHYTDGSIDHVHLAANAVDGDNIADDSINSEHYVDGSIDLAHMSANSVDSDQYVDGSIDHVHLSGDCIDGDNIQDDVINSEHIAAGAVDLEHMSANSVDSDQYVDGSIDHVHLANDCIDGDNIQDDVINSEHYAAGSIDTEHYAPNSVDNSALGGDCVHADNIADNSINSEHYIDGSIDHVHLAGDCVDGDNIQDDVINSEHIAAGAVDLEHMSSESVDEDNLHISNAGSDGQYLQKQSGNSGGLTWSTVSTTPTTTRGDIIYRAASADARLAKGTSGQFLKIGANDPEWADVPAGVGGATGLDLNDNVEIRLGTDNDLTFDHTGSDGIIRNGTGDFYIKGDDVKITGLNDENIAIFNENSDVQLYHNGTKTLSTNSEGITVQGGEGSTGSVYLYADDGDDNADKWVLQAKSDASAFTIQNNNAGAWDTNFKANGDAAVELYYDNSKKLETTSSGAKVSNTGSDVKIHTICSTSGYNQLCFGDTDDDDRGSILYNHTNDVMNFTCATEEKLRITPTTMAWYDGGTERLRFGTSGELGVGGTGSIQYGAAGQVLTSGGESAGMQWKTPGGKILQVVSCTKTNTFSETSVSCGDASANALQCDITPTASSSKILVIVDAMVSFNSDANRVGIVLRRAGTDIAIGDADGSRQRVSAGSAGDADTAVLNHVGLNHLDSPSTTSSTTYGIGLSHGSGSDKTMYLNRGGADSNNCYRFRSASHITLMEVAG